MHVKCQELVTELMQCPLHEHCTVCTHVLRTFLSFLINSALPQVRHTLHFLATSACNSAVRTALFGGILPRW